MCCPIIKARRILMMSWAITCSQQDDLNNGLLTKSPIFRCFHYSDPHCFQTINNGLIKIQYSDVWYSNGHWTFSKNEAIKLCDKQDLLPLFRCVPIVVQVLFQSLQLFLKLFMPNKKFGGRINFGDENIAVRTVQIQERTSVWWRKHFLGRINR